LTRPVTYANRRAHLWSGMRNIHHNLSPSGNNLTTRATDFFTVEVWTRRGLRRFMVLFFIELCTRKVEIAGIVQVGNGLWMSQIARNLTDAEQEILTGKRYLIHDRDPLFTAEFLKMIADGGVESVKLPPRSPNLNCLRGAIGRWRGPPISWRNRS
jgi:hypothetical protein